MKIFTVTATSLVLMIAGGQALKLKEGTTELTKLQEDMEAEA